MQNRDTEFLFEAYTKIYEAPVDPGEAWDEPDIVGKFDKGSRERLGKYKVSEDDTVIGIIDEIKQFLGQHENSHYPGTYKDFRSEVVDIVRNVSGIGNVNAGYAARVIQNELRRLGVITVDKKQDTVEVNDVEANKGVIDEELPDDVQAGIDPESVPETTQLILSGEYEIDRDIGANVSSEAKQVHRRLLSAGMGMGKFTGKQLVQASELPYSQAKVVLVELIEAGTVYLADKEEDSGEFEPLGSTEEEPEYAAQQYASQHFDVPRSDPYHGGLGEY